MPDTFPIVTGADVWRKAIHEKVTNALKQVFPIKGNNYTLELENVEVKSREYNPEELSKALMQASSLYEPVQGTLVLKDNRGKVVQRIKKHTLAQVPYLTPFHTFIIDGIPRTVTTQLRLKPGVYIRKKRNEELEAHFNTTGTTTPLRMTLEPETGRFYFNVKARKFPAYPVLKAFGVDDDTLKQHWNQQLLDANKTATIRKNPAVVARELFKALMTYNAPENVDVETARKILQQFRLDPEVTEKLLGTRYEALTPEAILRASNKLLFYAREVRKDIDERNDMSFKKIHGVDDFFAERILLDARENKAKLGRKLDTTADPKKALPSNFFGKGIQRFVTTAMVSGTPMQINPLEVLDHVTKVTVMGEGGIQTEHAIPDEARQLHLSHIGIIDPIKTPEDHRGGVELRLTYKVQRDLAGNIYVPLQDKTGKEIFVKNTDLFGKTIALPGYDAKKTRVDAIRTGQLVAVRPHEVDYIIPNSRRLFTIVTQGIPFLNSTEGSRALMGSKFLTQALPLKEPDAPLVRALAKKDGTSFEENIGKLLVPKAPASGTVTRVAHNAVYIKPALGAVSKAAMFNMTEKVATATDEIKVPIASLIPYSTKTFLGHKITVKPGDKVTAGAPLAETNFTVNNTLAIGKNLRVAYLPYYGMNTNDSMVVSESAAKKLTSIHLYREGVDLVPGMVADKKLFTAYFGSKYTSAQLNKLDEMGVVKPGEILNYGDLVIALAQKTELGPEAKLLGRIHKTLVRPYKDISISWDHDAPGVVKQVEKVGNKIRVAIYSEEPLRQGDKIASRYGHKGVVANIIPDDQMLKDSQGRTIDVVISPASVVTRLNPSQVLETAVAKVAEKTGKPVVVPNFELKDNLQYVKDLLKKHKISETEEVYDPIANRKYPKVLVGPQYIMKLMKTTDTNYSARGVEDVAYDVNQQPAGGGPTGAKAMGRLEVNALLAHGAKNILHEIATLKSQRNDMWWRAYQLGLPTPPLKTPFAYNKFAAMLTAAGVKVNKQDHFIQLGPLTDDEITKLSRGEIKKPLSVRAKDFAPEPGGLFDPTITGGLSGQHWGHFTLSEPIINPVFETSAVLLAKIGAGVDLKEIFLQQGGQAVKEVLKKLDLDKLRRDCIEKARVTEGAERDNYVRAVKYIDALKQSKLTPDKAYVISKVPVPPPVFRPLVFSEKLLLSADPNWLLRDAMLANTALSKAKEVSSGPLTVRAREHLYKTVGAVFGTEEPQSTQLRAKGVTGYMQRIAGKESPKMGYFQSALIRRRMDLSGRGTIIPDRNLGFDEVGLPEDMAWTLYAPFVIRTLVQRGYKISEAQDMVKNKHPLARDILLHETRQRPVLINRAPTLYRYNVLAAFPRLVPGKSIRIHDLMAPIQAGDFDGDAMNITVPVTPKAVEEAKEMTLSKMLLSDQQKFTLTKSVPQQEAILGLYLATKPEKRNPVEFKTKADALAAFQRGEININTPVRIKHG